MPSAARKRRRASATAASFSVLQLCVKRKMNSEVGIRDADFTLYKKRFLFEVGIRDADFGPVEVGIPYADFTVHLLPYKNCRNRRQAAQPQRLDSGFRWRPKATARPF